MLGQAARGWKPWALQPRPGAQEGAISAFQQGKYQGMPCSQAQGAQDRDGPPHRRKGRGARLQNPVFARMEARQQVGTVDRARRVAVRGIDEADRPTAIEPPHQGNLPAAERTPAVVPYDKLGHCHYIGTTGHKHSRA